MRACLLVLLVACGDGSTRPPPDSPPPVDHIELTGVQTDDGFSELRQGDRVRLVITGAHLDLATQVTVGALAAVIASQTAAELVAEVTVPHGQAIGPVALHVDDVELADALAITPYVVAPAGSATGHGTFAAPFALCDAAVTTIQVGDTLQLLAGAHTCDHELALPAGIHVTGTGATVGTRLSFGPSDGASATVIAGLTSTSGGILVDAALAGAVPVMIDDYHFSGPGTGLALFGVDATVTHSVIRDCTVGIQLDAGVDSFGTVFTSLHVIGGAIERCGEAARVGVPYDPEVVILDARFEGTTLGIAHIATGTLTLDQCASGGVAVDSGDLTITGGTVAGNVSVNVGDSGAAIPERSNAQLTNVAIDGTVAFRSVSDNSRLTLHGSTIHGGAAAVSVAGHATAALAGNTLTAAATGFALEDLRTGNAAPIDATGTTLDGQGFTGQTFTGPVTNAPFLRISDAGELRF